MKKIIIIAAAIAAMTACNKTLIEAPVADSDYGYIDFGITADSDMVVTKSSTNDYYVDLLRSDTENGSYQSVWNSPKQYSSITESDKKVQSGWYKIKAENNLYANIYSDSNQNGSEHVSGTGAAVQLTPGGTATLTVSCAVINTKVSITYTEKYASTFTTESVSVSVAEKVSGGETTQFSRSYSFPNNNNNISDDDNYSFFPANSLTTDQTDNYYYAQLTLAIKAQVNNNTREYSLARQSKRGYWTKITLDSGQNGTIEVSITTNEALNDKPVTETITLDPLSNDTVNNTGTN